jgi:hypothetical protein
MVEGLVRGASRILRTYLSQVQSLDFFLQPLHTPFSIGFPHFLHGVHPHS